MDARGGMWLGGLLMGFGLVWLFNTAWGGEHKHEMIANSPAWVSLYLIVSLVLIIWLSPRIARWLDNKENL